MYFFFVIIVDSPSLMHRFLPPANVVCEGYVFTGVCLSTGGSPTGRPRGQGYPPAGRPPSGQGDPPRQRDPPGRETPQQGDPPAGRPPRQGDPPGRETPLWQGDSRHTVNERAVCILLECIPVFVGKWNIKRSSKSLALISVEWSKILLYVYS